MRVCSKPRDFPRYFLNSILVSVSTAVIVTAVASFAGYALSRFRFRGKAAVSLVLLLTQTFPLVMVIPPIYRIMGQLGLTDNLSGSSSSIPPSTSPLRPS